MTFKKLPSKIFNLSDSAASAASAAFRIQLASDSRATATFYFRFLGNLGINLASSSFAAFYFTKNALLAEVWASF